MDKNVITRIETNKRYVTDIELKAFVEVFHVSYNYLIDNSKKGLNSPYTKFNSFKSIKSQS